MAQKRDKPPRIPPKRGTGPGKPPHEPTDATRKKVQLHATVGTPQAAIADIIGISEPTLRLHYRTELDHAKMEANANVGGSLYNKAIGGDTAAQIFWMKTQAQWHERHEFTGPGGGPIQHEVSARAILVDKIAQIIAREEADGDTGEPD